MLICQAVTLPVKRLATKAEILKGLFGQHRDLHLQPIWRPREIQRAVGWPSADLFIDREGGSTLENSANEGGHGRMEVGIHLPVLPTCTTLATVSRGFSDLESSKVPEFNVMYPGIPISVYPRVHAGARVTGESRLCTSGYLAA